MRNSGCVHLFLILCLFLGFIFCAGCTQKDGASPLVTGTPGVPVPPGQPDHGAPTGTCPELQIWCNGRCVDPATDMGNCGGCMNPCQPGQPCIGGKCGSAEPGGTGAPACEPGLILCNGNCMNVADDPDNCGSCGYRCPSGQPCTGGTCSSGVPGITSTPGIPITYTTSGTPWGGPICSSGLISCYGSCVDLQSDATHCGACNIKCASGKVCSAGSCTISCSAGQNNCGGGSCINTQTSTQHCGKCNNPCSSGQTCQNGKCGLYAGVMTLNPQDLCVGSGKLWCSGACVDQKTDSSNCGSCGNKCPSGQTCEKGKCGIFMSIVDPQQICTNSGKLWCSWVCVDQKTDTSNCGACGKKCKSGEPCSQGQCLSWTGTWKRLGTTGGDIDLITLVQTGSSVTGSDTLSPIFTYTGTTSGNPTVLAGTWKDSAGITGTFEFTMSADGKQFTGWFSYSGSINKNHVTATRQ